MRPPRLPPGLGRVHLEKRSAWQLNPLMFLAFCFILLYEADSAAILPSSLPYEADSAAILPFMLLYEADSDAMLHDFLHMKPIMLQFCFCEPLFFNENLRMPGSSADSADKV